MIDTSQIWHLNERDNEDLCVCVGGGIPGTALGLLLVLHYFWQCPGDHNRRTGIIPRLAEFRERALPGIP